MLKNLDFPWGKLIFHFLPVNQLIWLGYLFIFDRSDFFSMNDFLVLSYKMNGSDFLGSIVKLVQNFTIDPKVYLHFLDNTSKSWDLRKWQHKIEELHGSKMNWNWIDVVNPINSPFGFPGNVVLHSLFCQDSCCRFVVVPHSLFSML